MIAGIIHAILQNNVVLKFSNSHRNLCRMWSNTDIMRRLTAYCMIRPGTESSCMLECGSIRAMM